MWRYIVLNSLWFPILFLVHFFGSNRDRIIVMMAIAGAAFYTAFYGILDPFSWLFYLLFSVLVFYSSNQFINLRFRKDMGNSGIG